MWIFLPDSCCLHTHPFVFSEGSGRARAVHGVHLPAAGLKTLRERRPISSTTWTHCSLLGLSGAFILPFLTKAHVLWGHCEASGEQGSHETCQPSLGSHTGAWIKLWHGRVVTDRQNQHIQTKGEQSQWERVGCDGVAKPQASVQEMELEGWLGRP